MTCASWDNLLEKPEIGNGWSKASDRFPHRDSIRFQSASDRSFDFRFPALPMKISENWLRERVALKADHDALVERLNMIGHEVERVDRIGANLAGVVVARIVECAKHPEADRLQVCKVDAGNGEMLQVVCGAPNARPASTPMRRVCSSWPTTRRSASRWPTI
jgi:hypothetical protein